MLFVFLFESMFASSPCSIHGLHAVCEETELVKLIAYM